MRPPTKLRQGPACRRRADRKSRTRLPIAQARGRSSSGTMRVEIENVVLGTEERSGILSRHRNILSRAAQQCFESRRRIGALERQLAQRQVGVREHCARFTTCTLNPASCRLSAMRCAANCMVPSPSAASVSGGGVSPPRSSIRLVQVAIRWKEKCVAGERLRQKAGGDLALLLKDHVEERAAIDGLRNRRAQHSIRQRARVRNLRAPAARPAAKPPP